MTQPPGLVRVSWTDARELHSAATKAGHCCRAWHQCSVAPPSRSHGDNGAKRRSECLDWSLPRSTGVSTWANFDNGQWWLSLEPGLHVDLS